MIDRYVSEALHSTGTRTPMVQAEPVPMVPAPVPVPVPISRLRTARGSSAPGGMFVDPAATDFDEETTAVYERSPIYDTIFEG